METGEIGPTWLALRVRFHALLEGGYPLVAHLMTARFSSESVRAFMPVRLIEGLRALQGGMPWHIA
jgi:hypothetical protein